MPRWLVGLIVLVFIGHFTTMIVFNFSRDFLPRKLLYWSDAYVSPWFYQYLAAFAPDPPMQRRVFTFRVKTNGKWTQWNDPGQTYLEGQWSNRFSSDVKSLDMIEALGSNLYLTVVQNHHSVRDKKSEMLDLPACAAANNFIHQRTKGTEVDSAQFSVLIHELSLRNDSISWKTDSIVFPKYSISDDLD